MRGVPTGGMGRQEVALDDPKLLEAERGLAGFQHSGFRV